MSAARTVQAIRAHVPMIKFPSRLQGATGTTAGTSHTETSSAPVTSQSSGRQLPMDIFEEVPLRFRRKEISPEEMAYIERGGPE